MPCTSSPVPSTPPPAACISPPELSDLTLLTYLDGQASPQVAEHLRRCEHCRERAQRLAHLEGRLTAWLYRLTCPSALDLGEYHLGLLSSEQARAVREHLRECPHCSREVAQLESYLSALAPSLEPNPLGQALDRVQVWVARLIGGSAPRAPALAPAMAGLRGQEQAPLTYQAGDLQVLIEIQQDPDQPAHNVILGLIVGLGESQRLEAGLWHGGQRVMTVPVDELGNFVLPRVPPAIYELILSGPTTEIHIQELHVGGGATSPQQESDA